MKRLLIASGLCLLLTASSVLGAPTISIGTQYLSNTGGDQRIPIMVSSATHELVEGVNLAVQIGDGGLPNGGTDTMPRITNLDLIGSGTIFNASNTGSIPLYIGVGLQQNLPPYLIAIADTTTAAGQVEANGVLAWLTVNTAGTTVGSSFRVNLQNVGENDVNGPWMTDFTVIPASFPANDGWIVIVPEPSVFLLLLTACGVWLCRRKLKLGSK